jgi:hypothetical protein
MSNRMLGTIAMICAPALLVEALITGGEEKSLVIGLASMVFMAGWICSNTVMRRTRAAGTGRWGRAVLLVQLVGLVLAFLFGLFEATGLLGRDNLAFNVVDAAWPLSMLWMLVVGITVVIAGRMSGWRRFVPLLCGLWFPLGGVAMVAFGDESGVVGFGLAAVFWVLLGHVARSSDDEARGPALTAGHVAR